MPNGMYGGVRGGLNSPYSILCRDLTLDGNHVLRLTPSPQNEEWIARNFIPHLYHTKAKKCPVPHKYHTKNAQKCIRMTKNKNSAEPVFMGVKRYFSIKLRMGLEPTTY